MMTKHMDGERGEMTEEPKINGREQAWLDTLGVEELEVTKRLGGMHPQMQTFWLAVEIYRTQRSVAARAITTAKLTAAVVSGGTIAGGVYAALSQLGVL